MIVVSRAWCAGWLRRAAAALAFALLSQDAAAENFILYAGSYTSGTSKGIYAWRFDSDTGALAPLGLAAATAQPAHLWVAPNGKFLYAVNWHPDAPGTLSAFRIEPKGTPLTFLNTVSSHGLRPNQIVLDPSGKIAVTVNYRTGTLAAYKVLPDGKLSEAFYVQQHGDSPSSGAKTHGIEFSKDGTRMYVAELGLDRVYTYRVDVDTPRIAPAEPAFVQMHSGAGPRRLQLSPDDRFLYVNHESDSEVSVFAVRGDSLQDVQTITTLPKGATEKNTTAEIMIDKAGRHLYVSNRGHDSIAVYAVDPNKGTLTLQGNVPAGGRTPRNIRLDPTGRYLLSANEHGGTITVLEVDPSNGMLRATGTAVQIDTPGGMYCLADH
jgi:6-phosphogluconolactonase